MDGTELQRRIARQRAEWRARMRFSVLWRSPPEVATGATAADCVQSAREPWRRFDPLRRRPGPDPLATRWPARPTGGTPAGER